jgi:DNA-directed RNA polymerase specialized sigma24 family protein
MINNWIWMLPLNEEALDALVMRSQGGNVEALQELTELFRPRTRELIGSMADSADKARDILQEVFRRVSGAAQRHELGKNFSLWLYLQILDTMVESHRSGLLGPEGKAIHRASSESLPGKLSPANELFV